MPKGKRVNLTVPADLYQKVLAYREKYFIPTDASACLQLIAQRLDTLGQNEKILEIMKDYTVDELKELSKVGLAYAKGELKDPSETE